MIHDGECKCGHLRASSTQSCPVSSCCCATRPSVSSTGGSSFVYADSKGAKTAPRLSPENIGVWSGIWGAMMNKLEERGATPEIFRNFALRTAALCSVAIGETEESFLLCAKEAHQKNQAAQDRADAENPIPAPSTSDQH